MSETLLKDLKDLEMLKEYVDNLTVTPRTKLRILYKGQIVQISSITPVDSMKDGKIDQLLIEVE